MALRDSVMLTVVRCPFAYSFCASIITSVESLTDTVEGETPISSRKDFAAVVAIVVYVSALSVKKRSWCINSSSVGRLVVK